MLIARELRKTNIAEYILYMWQIEDLLRACLFEPDKIYSQLVSRYRADEEISKEIASWYINLASVMEKEQVREKGHLQVITNLVNDLNEFHLKLIEVQSDQEYVRLYWSNRDAIREFMEKSGNSLENEVESCLNALYGMMILKLKNAEISDATRKTTEGFGRLIGHLSTRYIQFENDDFEFYTD